MWHSSMNDLLTEGTQETNMTLVLLQADKFAKIHSYVLHNYHPPMPSGYS